MPKGFDTCVRNGGKVRTITGKQFGMSKGQYRHICTINGGSYYGHVKTKEKK